MIRLLHISRSVTPKAVSLSLVVTMLVSVVAYGWFFVPTDVRAADLTSISDTLTDSTPGSASDHTITFTIATAIPAGGSFSIDFQGTSAVFATGSVDFTDIDVTAPGELTLADCGLQGATEWGVCVAGSEIQFHAGASALINPGVVTVEIGTNATNVTTGDQQLTNPAATTGTEITIRTFNASDVLLDSGTTFVAIVDGVTLNAVVAATFTFTITGTASGETLTDLGGGSGVTTASASSDNYIGFGTLSAGTSVSMAQELNVSTNAANGFTVTVHQNHNMLASSSADIDSFADGTPATDSVWASPTGTIGDEDTYGHLGLHSTANLDAGLTASDSWFGLNGSALSTVWSHDGAADGATPDIGEIDMYYAVEITALQEAGRYQNRLTYIATPTF